MAPVTFSAFCAGSEAPAEIGGVAVLVMDAQDFAEDCACTDPGVALEAAEVVAGVEVVLLEAPAGVCELPSTALVMDGLVET